MTVSASAGNMHVPQNWGTKSDSGAAHELTNKGKSKGLEKRMTITLPPDAAKLLDFLSNLQGVSQVEAIRRAISTEAFVQGEIQEGSKILVKTASGDLKELVFR